MGKIRKLGELIKESRLTASTKSVVVANPSYMVDQIAGTVGSVTTLLTAVKSAKDLGAGTTAAVRRDASSTNDRIL